MNGKKTATRCPTIRAKVARLMNERNEMLNSTPPLTDWALNQIAELGLNGVDYWMKMNEQPEMKIGHDLMITLWPDSCKDKNCPHCKTKKVIASV